MVNAYYHGDDLIKAVELWKAVIPDMRNPSTHSEGRYGADHPDNPANQQQAAVDFASQDQLPYKENVPFQAQQNVDQSSKPAEAPVDPGRQKIYDQINAISEGGGSGASSSGGIAGAAKNIAGRAAGAVGGALQGAKEAVVGTPGDPMDQRLAALDDSYKPGTPGMAQNAFSSLSGAAGKAKEWLGAKGGQAAEAVSGAAGKVGEVAQAAGGQIAEGAQAAGGKAMEYGKKGLEGAAEMYGQAAPKVQEAAGAVAGKIGEAAQAAPGMARNAFSTLGGAAKTAAGMIGRGAQAAGQAAVDAAPGIAQGIGQGAQAAGRGAMAAGRGVANAAGTAMYGSDRSGRDASGLIMPGAGNLLGQAAAGVKGAVTGQGAMNAIEARNEGKFSTSAQPFDRTMQGDVKQNLSDAKATEAMGNLPQAAQEAMGYQTPDARMGTATTASTSTSAAPAAAPTTLSTSTSATPGAVVPGAPAGAAAPGAVVPGAPAGAAPAAEPQQGNATAQNILAQRAGKQLEAADERAATSGGVGTGVMSNLATLGLSGALRGGYNAYQRGQGRQDQATAESKLQGMAQAQPTYTRSLDVVDLTDHWELQKIRSAFREQDTTEAIRYAFG